MEVRRCHGVTPAYRARPQAARQALAERPQLPDDRAMEGMAEILVRQSGVVSRSQLLDLGLAPHDIRRLLRRRELVQVLPGVYLDHTGQPSCKQRGWAAVLALWPAALSHQSALPLDERRRRPEDPIHVAVDRDRSPTPPAGVRLHRVAQLEDKVVWTHSPPRVRIEEAVVDIAAAARDELSAIAALADAVQARLTTPERLREALARRSRVSRRAFLDDVLTDVGAGTCSVLEHGYLTRVERPHGLPTGLRQVRDSPRGPVYRDVAYRGLGTYVELDGRLFHDSARARDADLDRDLDAAVRGAVTVRLGWGQVFGRPCVTAMRVGRVLQLHGWSGAVRPCSRCVEATPRYAGATG